MIHNPKAVFDNPDQFIEFFKSPTFEGQYFDRKEVKKEGENAIKNVANGIIECVSGFANYNVDGGLIAIGISNSGIIEGIDHLTEDQRNTKLLGALEKLKHHATLSREISATKNDGTQVTILLLYTPYTYTGICETEEANPKGYKRQGPKCIQLTDTDKDQLKRDKKIVNFESQLCEVFHEEYLDQDVVEEFKRAFLENRDSRRDYSTKEILLAAGALSKDLVGTLYFTNAGYLFFAANPRRVISSAFIRLLKYNNSYENYVNPGTATFDRDIDGALPELIKKIRAFIKESAFFNVYTYRKPDGGFVEEPEYPTITIDEAIVNAVVHREYASNVPIRCIAYKDAFVVQNSGRVLQDAHRVPNQFSLKENELEHYPRNPKIVEWLRLLKDNDGSPFVRALSEGTKTMNEEMQKLGLPSPIYKTENRTNVILYNNALDREERFKLTEEQPSSEFGNFFKVIFDKNITALGFNNKTIKSELLKTLRDALSAQGWYIDKFSHSRMTVHQRGYSYETTSKVDKICKIFQAFVLQFKDYGDNLYLVIDYKAELKNVLSLTEVSKAISLNERNSIVNYKGKWVGGKVTNIINRSQSNVYIYDYEQVFEVNNDKIIPNLSKSEISLILKNQNITYDLDTKLKEFALASQMNSIKVRADKTIYAATTLLKDIMPIKYKNFSFTIIGSPTYLLQPNLRSANDVTKPLTVFQDIVEPVVEFNLQHKDADILNGLTRFGAYNHHEQIIEIIPVCLTTERSLMQKLIERLVSGKYKFPGIERTFGVKLTYSAIHTIDSYSELLDECKRLVNNNVSWQGDHNTDETLPRIFLVSLPEKIFSTDDINSPYYSIKEFLFEKGIPCQMIDAPTLSNPDFKDLNLCLNITAKCGRKPWVLPERLADADFFIGLSYTSNSQSKNSEKYMGFANVFDPFGKWQFYKGNTKAFDFDQRHKYFRELIQETLSDLSLNETPSLHFHYSAKFSREDINVILETAREIKPLGRFSFVWINDSHIIRLYDSLAQTNGSLSRGSYMITSRNQFYLSTTGNNIYKKSLGTPRMLEINVKEIGKTESGLIDYRLYAKQILSLTKLNWASTQALCGEPITIKYAHDIAYLTEKFIQRRGKFTLHPVLEKSPWFI